MLLVLFYRQRPHRCRSGEPARADDVRELPHDPRGASAAGQYPGVDVIHPSCALMLQRGTRAR
eukprot:1176766-Prorocentrum_minimum.AAC.3